MKNNNLEQNTKIERVFEIGAEGGGICITRRITEEGERFYYRHREFDPTDEGFEVIIDKEYDSFEEPFQLINDKYSWYLLFILTVHDDFKNYVTERLIERLNKDFVTPDTLRSTKYDWEDALEIKLIYDSTPESNFHWRFENI